MANPPKPRYTLWQGVSAALSAATRALEEVRTLSRIPGPQGSPGPRGADGLGFEDLSIDHDGERTVTLRFKRGKELLEKTIVFPVAIYRGVWKDGQVQPLRYGYTRRFDLVCACRY